MSADSHHEKEVLNYMRFARSRRFQFLKDLHQTFADIEEHQINETTFTRDEVVKMIKGLEAIVQSDVEQELVYCAHTNILLLKQYHQLAEHWHLKLTSNTSQLENRDLLEKVKEMEKADQMGTRKDLSNQSSQMKLAPVVDSSTLALLHQEIERLKIDSSQKQDSLSSITVEQKQKLEVLESELQERLQNSKAVQNLKRMLQKKNDQVRSLQQRLLKYEPSDSMAETDE